MKNRIFKLSAIGVLAGVYFALGKLGLRLAFINASTSAVWPPTGVALAVLLLLGIRLWPGVFVGAFLVNISTGLLVAKAAHLSTFHVLLTSLGIAAGNTFEAVLGAWLVNRMAGGKHAFESARTIFRFTLLAGIICTCLSASAGVISLCLGGFATWKEFNGIWFTWWLGDSVSNLIFAPFLLIWGTQFRRPLRHQQFWEGAALGVSILVVGEIVFGTWLPASTRSFALEYLGVPPLLWAAFRFGPRGAITAAFLLSMLALMGTLNQLGPFVVGNRNVSLLLLQAFMGTITLTSLVLAGVVSERAEARQRLFLQYELSRILADLPGVTEAAPRILQTVCQNAGWEIGVFWELDSENEVLRCREIWGKPGVPLEKFERASREQLFRPGEGLPGRIWESLQTTVIPNVQKDSNFLRASVAQEVGLQSAFGVPLQYGARLLGVMEFFTREQLTPHRDLLDLMTASGRQFGMFMERKRAQEALVRSQELYQRIVNTTNEGIWLVDADYRTSFVNPWMAAMLECSPEEMMGRSVLDFIFPEERPLLEERIRERLEGQFGRYDFRYQKKNGGELWALCCSSPLLDDDGKFCGALGMFTDISERRRAEEAVRKSDAFKGAILESSLDAIVSIDGAGKIVEFNPAASSIFGYAQADAIGRTMAELLVPERLRSAHYEGFVRYLATGQSRLLGKRVEIQALRADGSEFPVELTIARIHLEGAPYFTAYIRDITERKKAELALHQAQDKLSQYAGNLEKRVAERTAALKETIHSLESFTYSIAHDLRAPLRAMNGLAQIVLEDYSLLLDDPGRNYLSRITASAGRMDRMIHDLLLFGQITQMDVTLVPLNLEDEIRKSLLFLEEEIKSKKAQIELLPPFFKVQGNSVVLQQVFVNLITNSLKFVPTGQRPQVKISAENGDDNVRVWFKDNGIGIDPKYHQRIFKVFERQHQDSKYSGTGIGLALVQKGIERLGGRIGVQSEPGQGAQFWIELKKG